MLVRVALHQTRLRTPGLGLDAKGVAITDDKGHTGHVTIADVNQSNGVIHVVDTVLMP